MDVKIYRVFIRGAFNTFSKYYFIGDKEQLMTLIGILYSTTFIKIERIDYEIVDEEPEDMKQIKYGIDSHDGVFTYACKGGER